MAWPDNLCFFLNIGMNLESAPDIKYLHIFPVDTYYSILIQFWKTFVALIELSIQVRLRIKFKLYWLKK